MATIVVETGTGSASSNSYVSGADLTTYATDRGVTLSGTVAVLLIQAMDYIEQQNFKGTKGTDAQALQWPRYDVYVDDYYIDSDEIPTLLKDALCEVAIGIDGGNNPLANVERETIAESVGDISVQYSPNAMNQTYLKAAHYKLSKLLRNNGSAAVTIRA